jgi:hypothetical protein
MPFLTYAHPLLAFAFLLLFMFFKAIPDLTLLEILRVAYLNKKGDRHRLR